MLLLGLCLCGMAPVPEEGAQPEIFKLIDPNVDVAWLPIVPLGESVETLLPQTVYGYYTRFDIVECPVVWDTSVLGTPGRHQVPGTVSPPEGYTLKPGLETTSVTVAVYEEEPVVFFDPIKRITGMWEGPFLFPVGTDVQPLLSTTSFDIYSTMGDRIDVTPQWDTSRVDAAKVGRQTAYANISLPLGASFTAEQKPMPYPVYLMEKDGFGLDCYSVKVGSGISCEWLREIDPEQAVLEVSLDGKTWREAAEVLGNGFFLYPTSMTVDDSVLTVGQAYSFCIRLGSEYTNVLRVVIPPGEAPPEAEIGGDRDGGDGGGWKPGGGGNSQRPPTPDDDDDYPPTKPQTKPPEKPQEQSQPPRKTAGQTTTPPARPTVAEPTPQPVEDSFVELFGETRDLISGTRLLMMVDSAKQARFEKQGVTVTFSAQAMSTLGVLDSDRITVGVEKQGPDTVVVSFLVNGQPVTALADTQLMVPYDLQTPGAALLLQNSQGETVAQGSYDPALGVATFVVDATGRFTIVEEAIPDEPVPQATRPLRLPLLWLALPAAAAILLVGLLLKKRRHAHEGTP